MPTSKANKPKLVITDTFSTLVSDFNTVSLDLGATGELTTSQDSDVVGAINELDGELGVLSTLTTDEKGTIVGAINEIEDVFDASAKGISAGTYAFDITTTNASGISLDAPVVSLTGDLTLVDGEKIKLGTGADLEIYHNNTGNNSYIDEKGDGILYIRSDEIRLNKYTGEHMVRCEADGAVTLYHDGTSTLATTNSGIDVTGTLNLSEHLDMPDNAEIKVGTGDDLILLHDATTSIIKGDSIYIKAKSADENMASFTYNGAVNLYHDAASRLATTSGGVSIPDDLELGAASVIKSGGNAAITFANADVTMGGDISIAGMVDGRDVSVDGTKLDGIEPGATADQTDAEIRAAVEAATDSNVFTDADHSKLNAIENNATADQTDAEIKTAYENNSDTNAFTDADHSKLNAIEASATADQTASEILAKLITVDGASSDLDADLLDGEEGSYYATAASVTTNTTAIGTLTSLSSAITVDRTNLVAVINELQQDITQLNTANGENADLVGTLAQLDTQDKDDCVVAINELHGDIATNTTAIGNNNTAIGTNTTDIGNNTTAIGTNTTKLNTIDTNADVNRTDAQIKTSIGTGNGKFVPAVGTSGHFLKHDGTFGLPPNTEYSTATNTTLGLVKIGYSTTGKNYAVQLSSGQMYVNVPWVNTNTNTNQLTTFIVRDGDDTAVTIGQGKNLQFIEGQGIDINFTDITSGTNGDPYDMTFGIKPNGVSANELNVTGNGSTTKFLRSNGDGSFTWAVPVDTNTTYTVGDGGLTTNDFTNADHSKLDNIAAGATNDTTAIDTLNSFVEPTQSLTTTATTVADAINELKASIPLIYAADGTTVLN